MISADLAEAVGRLLRDRCSPDVVRAAEEGKPAAALAEDEDGRLFVACVPSSALTVTAGRNLAGEPRGGVTLAATGLDTGRVRPAPDGVTFETLFARGALARAALMAGALRRVAEMTAAYAGERHQFGQPINRLMPPWPRRPPDGRELPWGSYQPGLGMDGLHSPEFSRKLGARGWLGMRVPPEYGGGGRTSLERFVVTEELLAAGRR